MNKLLPGVRIVESFDHRSLARMPGSLSPSEALRPGTR